MGDLKQSTIDKNVIRYQAGKTIDKISDDFLSNKVGIPPLSSAASSCHTKDRIIRRNFKWQS